jgi:hypothetical protein
MLLFFLIIVGFGAIAAVINAMLGPSAASVILT